MISTSPRVSPGELKRLSGWELKPEGLCRGDICVPFRHDDPSGFGGEIELAAVAARLGMALLHDDKHGLWALGPQVERGARFLSDARFPDITLPDLDGQPFSFSSLLGRKVVMVAWASW